LPIKPHPRQPFPGRGPKRRGPDRGGFTCQHCHAVVSADPRLSGVQNRNHCPHCLWSSHVDQERAGDRLASCGSRMEPIGLTVKAIRKRYGPGLGELMLIHLCRGCDRLSINRIAADDSPEVMLTVYESSFRMSAPLRSRLEADGIRLLAEADRELVRTQLYGRSAPSESA
jgi:hypothetical protein